MVQSSPEGEIPHAIASNGRITVAEADTRRLSLLMACNSIRLAQEIRLSRNPEQLKLHHTRLRNTAEDEARRAFDKRTDLVRPRISLSEMNRAYAALMAEFAYEAPDVRDQASRRIIAWIARNTQPRMDARDIVRAAVETGALKQ